MQLGDPAPDFTAWSTASATEPLHFYSWLQDSWCILFSHPADFTPVCTTELGAVARLYTGFEERKCKVLALSIDPLDAHHAWTKDIEETQKCTVTFPIVADDGTVARLYGMLDNPLHDPTNMRDGLPLTVRTVFIIDPKRKVRLMLTYPASVGRNFTEILRTLDALQLTDCRPVATPADWQPGQEVIVRFDMSDQDAEKEFGSFRTVKPYLRFTQLSEK
jgi:alkyl hydroperoxide reductase subunit AhpC